MMRPTTRNFVALPLAAAILSLLLAACPAQAGIIVTGGTVQPIPDPFGIYSFDVNFNPVTGESIQQGDSFTVTSTVPLVPFYGGTNVQPAGWIASFSNAVAGATPFAEYYTVTWTLLGAPVTSGGSLDPGPVFFQVSSPDDSSANFNYTFSDTIKGQTSPNTGGGSFMIVVPEPASLVMCSFSACAGFYLYRVRTSRARRQIA